MAVQVSAEKKKAYQEAFGLFDKDGNGQISKDEIRSVLKELKRDPSEADLDNIVAELDTDKSGFIEYNEFEQMMIALDALIEKEMKAAFDRIDQDGSGFISIEEMDGVFKSLGVTLTPDELKKEMELVDRNSDGKISFDEFKKIFEAV